MSDQQSPSVPVYEVPYEVFLRLSLETGSKILARHYREQARQRRFEERMDADPSVTRAGND